MEADRRRASENRTVMKSFICLRSTMFWNSRCSDAERLAVKRAGQRGTSSGRRWFKLTNPLLLLLVLLLLRAGPR